MISRQKLQEIKSAAKRKDYQPHVQTIHTLVDAALELMDYVDGGNTHVELDAEAKKALRQVIKYATEAYEEGTKAEHDHDRLMTELWRTRYTADLAWRMMNEPAARRRPWSHYTPQIEEEFEDDRQQA